MGLLYTRMKVFHFQQKIDSLPREVDRILPPLHIRIKPTNICNHHCHYCAYRADDLQLGRNMKDRDFIPKDKILEIIEDLVEIGVKAVTFSGGGEPFCYPYLLDAVKRLSEGPIRFASLTNGSRLEGEVAEIFAHQATWLRVSIDGWNDESYSEYRGVPAGEFTRVMNNLERFQKQGPSCYLGVSLIVDRKNGPRLYDMVKRLKQTGVNSVKISPCIVSNGGAENNAYHAPVFLRVKEQIARAIDDLSDDRFEVYDAYHSLDEKFKKDYDWCPYLQI